MILPPVAFFMMLYVCSFLFGGPVTIPLMVGVDHGWLAFIGTAIIFNGVGLGSFGVACWMDKNEMTSSEDMDKALMAWLAIVTVWLILLTMWDQPI